DSDVRLAAEQLYPYGMKWVSALGREFFAASEDRQQLEEIVNRLQREAEEEKHQEEAMQSAWSIKTTAEGEPCTPMALSILRKAEAAGYTVTIEGDGTIVVSNEEAKSYLQSNSDIILFGKNRLITKNDSER